MNEVTHRSSLWHFQPDGTYTFPGAVVHSVFGGDSTLTFVVEGGSAHSDATLRNVGGLSMQCLVQRLAAVVLNLAFAMEP